MKLKSAFHTILCYFCFAAIVACSKDNPSPTDQHGDNTGTVQVPMMVKGVYGVNIPEMQLAKSYGFNVIQSYQLKGMTDAQVRDYMDAAQKAGLKVMFHLGVNVYSQEEFDKVMRRVQQFKGHPALHAWYLSDEPSIKNISPDDLKKIYTWIKNTDPAHKIQSSNWELSNFKDAMDLDMRQFYNGPPSALRLGNTLNTYPANAAKLGVKWIAIANTHDHDFPAYNLPGAETLSPAFIRENLTAGSPEESAALEKIKKIQANLENPPYQTLGSYPDSPRKIRGQAWDLIAHGSDGLYYWLLQPETSLNDRWGYYTIFVRPALRQALKEVLAETESLWPRVYTPLENATTWLAGTNNEVFFWCRKSGKEVTIIAVNESIKQINVSTNVVALAGISSATMQVSTENRTVTVNNGTLQDAFEPDEAHIYTLTLK